MCPFCPLGCSVVARAHGPSNPGLVKNGPIRRPRRGICPRAGPSPTACAAPGSLDQWSRPPTRAPGARPESPIPMPSRSVQPAGRRHLWRRRRRRGHPERAGCTPGVRGTAAIRVRLAVPAAAGVRGVNPLGTSARSFRPGRGSAGPTAACAACCHARQAGARGGHSRAGCPGPTGFPVPGTVAPARGRCAPGTAHSRAPLASGCRGTPTRSIRGHWFRAVARCCARPAPRRPRVIRAAGVCQSRWCRARRRQERCGRRRPAASAYAPGRRHNGHQGS